MARFTINGRRKSVDVDPDTPLLWVVREHLKMTGTKFGCGAGLCGDHAPPTLPKLRVNPLPRSRDCLIRPLTICRKHGLRSRYRNAVTASRARSCKLRLCSVKTKTLHARKLSRTWTETSAGVVRTTESSAQFSARRGRHKPWHKKSLVNQQALAKSVVAAFLAALRD